MNKIKVILVVDIIKIKKAGIKDYRMVGIKVKLTTNMNRNQV